MARKDSMRITRRQAIGAALTTAAAAGGRKLMAEPLAALSVDSTIRPHRLLPVSIDSVTIDDEFWAPKREIWRSVTIGDCFTKFENDRGGAMNNFDLVRDGKKGRHAGPPWYDGLIYEMIRGSADFLAAKRDPALESQIDGYIERIVAAQAKDPTGYINTWTQTMLPQTQRWGMNGGDDREQHDVYNAGMMIEAGIHYYRATGKVALLEAATRMANLMSDTIGRPPRANVIPGHSGPEEALVNLYLLYRSDPAASRSVSVPVHSERYLELAEFFINARGHYGGRTGKVKSFGDYGQDQAPLALQTSLEGHAVRATLFSSGITAAANVTGRAEYLAAAQRFWDSLVLHKMYVTGAAGAIAGEEKLGPDYFLPNDGYMETCAAVGLGFFSHNMNLLFGESHYVDELERALYNAVLGGVGLSGHNYYYQDPLAGEGLRRWEWHDCPCCPPMFLKIMGALSGYIYAQEKSAVYVNLFIQSRASIRIGGASIDIRQKTRFPWSGEVQILVEPEKQMEFDLCVRIPDWANNSEGLGSPYHAEGAPPDSSATLHVNGDPVGPLEIVRGYAVVRRRWNSGDEVRIDLPMPFRKMQANSGVVADRGLVALMRGPMVYCVNRLTIRRGCVIWLSMRIRRLLQYLRRTCSGE